MVRIQVFKVLQLFGETQHWCLGQSLRLIRSVKTKPIYIAIKAWLSAEQFWILIIYVWVDNVFDFIEEVRQRFLRSFLMPWILVSERGIGSFKERRTYLVVHSGEKESLSLLWACLPLRLAKVHYTRWAMLILVTFAVWASLWNPISVTIEYMFAIRSVKRCMIPESIWDIQKPQGQLLHKHGSLGNFLARHYPNASWLFRGHTCGKFRASCSNIPNHRTESVAFGKVASLIASKLGSWVITAFS